MHNPLVSTFFICQATFGRPLNDMTAPEVLTEEGKFTNFVRALELSGAADMLEKKGPYTIFAPVDEVFNVQYIGQITGSYELLEIVYRFIVPGKYTYKDIQRLQMLNTVSGFPLTITVKDGVRVGGAEITRPDLPYDKGLIHEINMAMEPLERNKIGSG